MKINLLKTFATTTLTTLLTVAPFVTLTNNATANVTSADKKVNFSGTIAWDLSTVNGEENGNASRFLAHLYSETDLSSFLGKGAMFNAGLAIKRGSDVTELELAQGLDNIDADEFEGLYEVVLVLKPVENGTLKIGQQDANIDFSVVNNAGEFLNPSMGHSPTIIMPSYNDPVMAVSYLHQVSDKLSFSFGVFESAVTIDEDGYFNDTFTIVEAGYQVNDSTNVKLGFWRDTAVDLTKPYMILDHQINQDYSAFMQFGSGNANTIGLDSHLGFGVNKHGVFTGEDMTGIAYTQVSDGDTEERIVEVYYTQQVSKWIKMTLDMQYITNPAFNQAVDDALAFTLRVASAF